MRSDGGATVAQVSNVKATGAPAADQSLAFACEFAAEPMAVRAGLLSTLGRLRGHIGADDASALELVLAEVCNNIVEHAYRGIEGGRIGVSFSVSDEVMDCCVTDRGLPMPGSRLPEGVPPELIGDGDPDQLPEGGFGWFLIHDLTEALSYVRHDGQNELRFTICRAV